MEEYIAKRVTVKPPVSVVPKYNCQTYAYQVAHVTTTATHATYHTDPQQQHYDHNAAAAHHVYYANPNAAVLFK